MEWIFVLAACGLLLVIAEIFLPGGILGLTGAGCLIAASVLAFQEWGPAGGAMFTLAEIALGAVVILQAVRWIQNSPIGKGLVLDAAVEGIAPAKENADLLGREGVALTQLRPAGAARIDGHRHDVISEGGLIDAGTPLKVISVEGMRVVVRPVERTVETKGKSS